MASQTFPLSTPLLFFSLLASFFTSFAFLASGAEVANGRKEAEALIEWKVSLDKMKMKNYTIILY